MLPRLLDDLALGVAENDLDGAEPAGQLLQGAHRDDSLFCCTTPDIRDFI